MPVGKALIVELAAASGEADSESGLMRRNAQGVPGLEILAEQDRLTLSVADLIQL